MPILKPRAKARSAFIRSAAELYLQAKKRRTIDEKLVRAYSGRADELFEEASELIAAQSWPDD